MIQQIEEVGKMMRCFEILSYGWRRMREERGAATAEYALILALVVVVLIGTLTTLGDALTDKLGDIIAGLQSS